MQPEPAQDHDHPAARDRGYRAPARSGAGDPGAALGRGECEQAQSFRTRSTRPATSSCASSRTSSIGGSPHDRPLVARNGKSLIEPVLAAATAPYGYARGAFPRVMLARMAPGGVIHPHRDENPAAKWPHKIHVPIANERSDVTFFVDRCRATISPRAKRSRSTTWALHAVENRGSTDRIHLIFEYYDLDQPEPEWLAQLQPSGPGLLREAPRRLGEHRHALRPFRRPGRGSQCRR